MRLFLAHVIALALALVAGVAEVCRAPTEPLSNRAAEATFELDEILAVRFAILSSSDTHSGTRGTN